MPSQPQLPSLQPSCARQGDARPAADERSAALAREGEGRDGHMRVHAALRKALRRAPPRAVGDRRELLRRGEAAQVQRPPGDDGSQQRCHALQRRPAGRRPPGGDREVEARPHLMLRAPQPRIARGRGLAGFSAGGLKPGEVPEPKPLEEELVREAPPEDIVQPQRCIHPPAVAQGRACVVSGRRHPTARWRAREDKAPASARTTCKMP
mmetsp:Transcript_18481/g.52548  ORF Transcript_18481/g.52548 Transcript_18481/m.52548 type:complete len:209 (-) Transcript_18481:32-658(-)